MSDTEVKTWCRLCFARCPLTLNIRDGRIEGVRPRDSYVCPAGLALGRIVHAPDRLLHPLQKLPGGGWREINWEQALDILSARLRTTARLYGPSALSVHIGQARSHYDLMDYVRRFCRFYGTPNLSSSSSQCYCGRTIGNRLTCGYIPVPDYARTRAILVWGCNPAASNPYAAGEILKAVSRGARLLVIDPRDTALAWRADLHLAVRPGGDRALALAMLHVIVKEQLYDAGFVQEWTLGFEQLAGALQPFSPENVAPLTGITPDEIARAARFYAASQPACIMMGNALEQQVEGVQTIRAIALLQALCGSLEAPGGALYNPGYTLADISLESLQSRTPAVGQELFPAYYSVKKEAQGNLLMDAVLEGKPYPVRSMIISGANPLLSFPNSRKVQKALTKLDFLAVMDLFMTDTARLADLVLPAAFFLERSDLCDLLPQRPRPYPALLPPVLPPPAETRSDWQFWSDLAGRLGFESCFPWPDYTSASYSRAEAVGLDPASLSADPDDHRPPAPDYYRYRTAGFPTRSGKVELYSDQLAALGHNPLPTDPLVKPDPRVLSLSAGARLSGYILSRFRNIPALRHRRPAPLVEIASALAERYGLRNGQSIRLRTSNGEIAVKVVIAPVADRTFFMSHGWSEANPNRLTSDSVLDPISGFPNLRHTPVIVLPDSPSSETPR